MRCPYVVWLPLDLLASLDLDDVMHEAPPICVEVLSPSNKATDLQHKIELYFEHGAQEVWICDGEGGMSFFNASGELEFSVLCSKFPKKVDLNIKK